MSKNKGCACKILIFELRTGVPILKLFQFVIPFAEVEFLYHSKLESVPILEKFIFDYFSLFVAM